MKKNGRGRVIKWTKRRVVTLEARRGNFLERKGKERN